VVSCNELQGGGTGLILIWQEKSGIPPNPPSAFLLLKRNGNGKHEREKIPSPQPPSFLPVCLSFALRFFWRVNGGTKRERNDNNEEKTLAPFSRACVFEILLPFSFTIIKYFGNSRLWETA